MAVVIIPAYRTDGALVEVVNELQREKLVTTAAAMNTGTCLMKSRKSASCSIIVKTEVKEPR